uniref:Protein phosphatase 2a regulatory subunit a n=1 Tax=Triatoma infestans TaxID=30076 RepID=A0A023EYQ8_TRIIF
MSYNDIASKLIKDKFWLTALELHTELVEAGKEVPKLKEFFSNPVNFESQSVGLLPTIARSSSQATLDSLDLTRFSEDGERGNDERVAVLEFELRKAKETISALRANLTIATVEGTNVTSHGQCDTIKPHEQRALNFLINEYLLMRGYKLTSITFADENEDQDFEDWDDVGLNTAKPAELLQIYRVGITQRDTVATCDNQTQTEDQITSVDEILEGELDVLETENMFQVESKNESRSVAVQCEDRSETGGGAGGSAGGGGSIVTANHSDLSGSFEEINRTEFTGDGVTTKECEVSREDLDIRGDEGNRDLEVTSMSGDLEMMIEVEEDSVASSISSHPFVDGSPSISAHLTDLTDLSNFDRELWTHLPQLKSGMVSVSYEMLVQTLGSTIISIVHHLPISNREWISKIVPILVCLVGLHPDEKVRDSLIHCLFNMKKRPSQEDRNVILAGIIRLCHVCSEELVQGELLSQCWDLLGHKYPERRMLVAQTCALVSPIISSELRDSLLISILKQLLEDRDETVRTQSVTSLAVVASYMTGKYPQVEELTICAIQDKSEIVVKAAETLLLPVVARWALQQKCLHSSLVPVVLEALNLLISNEEKESRSCWMVNCITRLLPHIVMFAATSPTVLDAISPNIPPPQHRTGFAEVCKGLANPVLFYNDHPVGVVIGAFDFCLQQLTPWPQLAWIIDSLIPKCLDIIDKVDPKKEELIMSFVKFFSSFTAGFGTIFTTQHVKSIFLDRLEILEKALLKMDKTWPPLSIIPVYILGVLAPLQCCEEELGQCVGRLVIMLGLCSAPLQTLHITVKKLATISRLSNTLLSALWQGVVHQRGAVRCTTAELLMDTVPHCSEQIISNRIIPALVTLASDPDVSVRVSTLPVYSLILESSSNKEVLDKTYLQVQTIIKDTSATEKASTLPLVITSIGKMASVVDSSFRDEVLLLELDRITKFSFDLDNQSQKSEIAATLVDTLSNIIFLQISKHCLNSTLLPILRLLETFCNEVLPSHQDTVSAMIKEVETRVGAPSTSIQR